MKRLLLIATFICGSLIMLESCSPKTTTSGTTASRRGDVTGNWTVNGCNFRWNS
jgi:hypothetical protein